MLENSPRPIHIYRHRFIVPAESVDMNHHVNNVAYIQWMQDVAVAHSGAWGATDEMRELGATWVAGGHRIAYRKPAFDGEEIGVVTWAEEMSRVKVLRKYVFIRFSDKAILAKAETDWVFVDAATGRPKLITKAFAAIMPVQPEEPPLFEDWGDVPPAR